MRILIIHQYYLHKDDPGISRFNQFTKYWSAHGHQITVLCGTVHHMTGKKLEKYKGRLITKEKESDAVSLVRCAVSESYNKNFAGRLWAYFSFTFSSIIGIFFVKKHDIVIATSPPLFTGITGYIASRLWRVPFVFEVRDLWPESAIDLKVLTNPALIKMSYWLEHFIYKKAQKINVLTPAFREHLIAKKNIPPEKLIFIPNGADLDILHATIDLEQFKKHYQLENKFILLYIGAHGLANALHQILETAELIKDMYPRAISELKVPQQVAENFTKTRPPKPVGEGGLKEYTDILFLFIGDGMYKKKLVELANQKQLINVRFIDPQPKQTIANFILASDAGVAVLKKIDTFKTVYPNKIFDYMACGKPVLVGIDGIARKLVEDARAGIFFEPENTQEFKNALMRIYHDRSLANTMGHNGYEYVKKNYSRETLADRYEQELCRLVS
ncbi:MAG: glycosyltransferase family 4 protein [Parcubacteria group bacterium]|nr:glycosyltransferase family 4 protein [Parcubacteria group bacterium]